MEIDFKGLTVHSVMQRAKIDESTYYRIKNNESKKPRQSTIDKIEQTIQEMLEEKEKYSISPESLKAMKIKMVEYRVKTGVSQRKLLSLCGVSPTTYHRFQEKGYISLKTYKKIVDFLEKENAAA